MKSILNAVQKQNIPIKPTIVISNKPSANGLKIARKFGVQTEIVESKGFQGTRWEYDQKIIHVLSKYGITPKNSLICSVLAGANERVTGVIDLRLCGPDCQTNVPVSGMACPLPSVVLVQWSGRPPDLGSDPRWATPTRAKAR